MHSVRLAAAVVRMVLAPCFLIITPTDAAAEEYDITNCGASTITTLSSSAEMTLLAIDTKGVAVSNHPKKAFDNASFHSVSLVRIVSGQRMGTIFSRFLDADGDAVVGETTIAPTEMTWRFLEGSGKWRESRGVGRPCRSRTRSRSFPARPRGACGRPGPTRFGSSA